MDDNDGIAIRSVDDIARDGGVMLQHHLHARVRLHGLRLLCLLWSLGFAVVEIEKIDKVLFYNHGDWFDCARHINLHTYFRIIKG